MNSASRFAMYVAVAALGAGSSPAQVQVQKLLNAHATPSDGYGARCSIDGDWAIVGASTSNLVAAGAGAAFMFKRSNGVWIETQTLLASVAQSGDSFGFWVDIADPYVVVGAINSRGSGSIRCGAAYAYERVGDTWIERQKLVPPIELANSQFGNHVAISGDRIVVGSWFESIGGSQLGSAYVYERGGATWTQVARLQPIDLVPSAHFGMSAEIDGNTIACGAWGGRVAYTFKRDPTGMWTQQQKLTYPGNSLQPGWNFGARAVLGGTTLFILSEDTVGTASRAGRAYVYEEQAGVWVNTQTLTSNDIESQDAFYISDVQGDVAVGSAIFDDDAVGGDSGAAYIFERRFGTWIQTAKVLANDAVLGQWLGYEPQLSGSTLLIGAAGDDSGCPIGENCNTGAYYVYELPVHTMQYGSCYSSAPCGNTDNHGGCRNSTGHGAILQASGSGSVTTDDLVLEVRKMPPGTATLMFMGAGQSNIPLGSGQLVATGGALGLYRLGVQFADGNGVIVRPPGLVAYLQLLGGLGAISAGQTWNFQCWYRDVLSPCGITNNLSNGLSVGFTP